MAQHYDGNIAIPACDKNMPGCLMAAVRHNRPTILIYGGKLHDASGITTLSIHHVRHHSGWSASPGLSQHERAKRGIGMGCLAPQVCCAFLIYELDQHFRRF
jgi:dihydroxyacid dehydratase/phosphogluconate dehydratase